MQNQISVTEEDARFKEPIQQITRILRPLGLTYQQSKYVIEQVRKNLELKDTIKKPKTIRIPLSPEDIEKLINSAYSLNKQYGTTYGTMTKTFFYTGGRNQEIATLKIENIDFEQRIIRIEKGKGQKDRLIPIAKPLHDTLRTYIGSRQSGYVFLSNRTKPFTARRVQQIVQKAKIKAGIQGEVVPHSLRHSIATYLLNKNMDIREVQLILGHESIDTTAVYTHVAVDHLKEKIDKVFQ